MDKEAQEKIANRLDEVEYELTHGPCILDKKAFALRIFTDLTELGYRKLPKDKPPLLTGEEMEQIYDQALKDKPYVYFPEEVYPRQKQYRHIAQAQRETDIKHYEGGQR